MRVFVYYNLHRKLWSVRALEGPRKGLVIHHATSVLLGGDVRPKVSQKGRERVIRDKRKNVHAGITGHLVWHNGTEGTDEVLFPGPETREVTYNPYKYTSFVYSDTLDEFEGASWAYMDNRRVHVL